jgi:hypothetical protein
MNCPQLVIARSAATKQYSRNARWIAAVGFASLAMINERFSNAARNPLGYSHHETGFVTPAGFFAALRMTET